MERETGLKPATFALATRRSINWAIPAFKNGGQRWNRTTDTRIFSPLLYQLSYLTILKKMATWMGLEPTTSAVTGRRSNQLNYQAKNKKSGGHNRARTYDPLLVRQMLSQLSYAPTFSVCEYNYIKKNVFCQHIFLFFCIFPLIKLNFFWFTIFYFICC